MRVIAGKFRGRNLKSPPSLEVRPTSDRLRETLFNVLAPRISGARFLDLCAGSGAVGIEALSRDAAHSTFVDKSRKMCALIKSNLDLCKIDDIQAEVVLSDAAAFIRRAGKGSNEPWDIVFFDPPYALDYLPVLEALGSTRSLLSEKGRVVVEHHHKKELGETINGLVRVRKLKQGDSILSFYKPTLIGGMKSLPSAVADG